MIEFRLFGYIAPTFQAFTLHNFNQEIKWQTNTEKEFTFRVLVGNGKVEVIVAAPAYNDETIVSVRIAITMALGSILALHSFRTGEPYTLFLDEIEPPGGVRQPFVVANPRLAALASALDGTEAVPVWEMVMGDSLLMWIFQDIAMALSQVLYQPIACGRALDGIRNYLAPTLSPKPGWAEVRRLLNLSEGYPRYVTDLATKPRHREAHNFGSPEVQEAITRTWTIANRLLAFCLTGRAPLTGPEFPLL